MFAAPIKAIISTTKKRHWFIENTAKLMANNCSMLDIKDVFQTIIMVVSFLKTSAINVITAANSQLVWKRFKWVQCSTDLSITSGV